MRSEIALIARHYSAGDYFTCTFSNDGVYLEKHEDNVQNTMVTTPRAAPDLTHASLGIRVHGPTVSCIENGVIISTAASSNPKLESGGIGLQVWDKTMGQANAEVSSVDVEPIK